MDSATAVPFEGLDLPALSSRSPLTYRHTTHGLQKQELSRTDSAAIRESEELAGGQEQRDAEVAQQERRETQAADRLGHLFNYSRNSAETRIHMQQHYMHSPKPKPPDPPPTDHPGG